MSNKYYELDNNGNYILTTKDEVYSYINYKYFDINYIKELINIASKENNIYKVKLSALILNNTTDNYITITVNEENKSIVIDYTELFKIDDDNINMFLVNHKSPCFIRDKEEKYIYLILPVNFTA